MRHKGKSLLTKITLLIALSIVIYVTWTYAVPSEYPETPGSARASNFPTPVQETQTQNIERKAMESTGTKDPQTAPGFTIPIHIDDIVNMRYLELININHAINGEPEGRMLESAWPTVPVSKTEISVHGGVLDALSDLFIAARRADAGNIFVSSGYRMDLGSTSYTVLYQVPQDGMLYLPGYMDYWVSSDNTGGYIITAWE